MKTKILGITTIVVLILLVVTINFAFFSENKTNDEFTIGVIAPLTGAQAFLGEGIVQGIKLAVNEMQANGEKVKAIYEDSQGDVATAVSAYNKIKATSDVDVFVLVSTGDEAILDLAGKDKIPVILTVSSTSGLPSKNKYTFRYFTNADDDAPEMAKYAVNSLGLKKFGVLHLLDNFGISYSNVFSKEVAKLGGEVVVSESFQYTDVDYKTQLAKLAEKDIDSIYVIGLDYQEIEALKEIEELGIDKQIIAVGTIAGQYSLKDSQGAAEGVYVTAFCTDGTPAGFVEKFQSRYSSYPSFFAEMGYDIGEIVDRANKEGEVSTSEFMGNLHLIQNMRTNVGIVNTDSSGEIKIPTCAKVIQEDNKIFNLVTGQYSYY
jgi:branched-chain amino acid transport system substrate-binding protein